LLPATAKYIVQLIKTTSPGHCEATFKSIVRFARFVADFEGQHGPASAILSSVYSEYRALLSANACEQELHRVRPWFLWAADNAYEAFSPEAAFEIDHMRIPGGPRGRAVLSEDPEEGPLTEEEVVALLAALRSDRAASLLTLQQRTALWLCFALGRNPANFCLLQEQDLVTFKADGVEATAYEVMVPRIKKSRAREREEFKRQKLTPQIAQLVQQLIAENATSRPMPADTPKWLFRRATAHSHSVNSEDGEFSYVMYVDEFTVMIANAIKKLGIKSTVTGKPLKMTTRRLRYTYATRLVDEGISHRGLAEALDHTDLQHILVYFNARSNIVRRIDAAIALQIAPLARAFAGEIVSSESDAVRGKDPASRIFRENTVVGKLEGIGSCASFSFCGLGPPIACYTCRKFQPWRGARHEELLNDLLEDRERKFESGMDPRMVKLLDPTIYAVAEVVGRIKQADGTAEQEVT
jgi:integrase